ncbi:DUF2125 domain-containing protein [Cognatishimia activa]|uniref:DUF2125 domain-containing protein n=1 Tax=Cognatishimia activa TaxID=1715691 RepID=UPI00222EB620|nr:DUF2125 domain-containing protein [Cognatishimia activa]UZD90917.1 DUF2125 domain-containing protein [Cognatishimia activa]
MSRWTQLSGATALAGIFAASAVQADVTGQEVWSDWKSYMEDFGYSVEGTESRSGDTLTISDLTMSFDIPQDEGNVVMTMPELTFTDQGDGTVLVGMPQKSSFKIDAESPEGDAVAIDVAIDMTGMSTVVSGEPNDMTYSYTAASLVVELADFEVVGEDAPDDLQFVMTMDNLIGQSSMKIGDMREIEQNMSAAGVTYEVRIVDSSEDANVVITGAVDGLSFEGGGLVPIGIDMEDPEALFEAGFAMDGSFRQNGSEFQLTAVEDDQPVNVDMTSGGSEVEVAFSSEGIGYLGSGSDLSINLVGGDVPFPIAFTLEEIGYEFEMPLAASEEEQDFALGLTFGGLSVPEMLWNIFDPSAILPRDPATLSFTLDGKTRIFTSLLDPSIEDSDEFPGELTALTLSDFVVEIAGAELTGEGDFTFDNTDMDSFDGMPRPLGAAEFRLLGGNGLLDKLIQMGFVGEDDAMGARMMMGIFATPGPSEDELNSRIEVNESGHVLANGQRIK